MTDAASQNGAIDRDWYASAFGRFYPIVYAHRTVEAAAPEIAFAAGCLKLGASDRTLDLCCGNGRHLAGALNYTSRLVGLDYSPDLLRLARGQLGPACALLRGDMRALPFVDCFDVVLNFFTSFGYFMDQAENEAVAKGLGRALKRNGRFFIDYFNAAHVEATLVPHSVREVESFVITEDRWIDREHGRVNKATVVCKDESLVARWQESVRMYSFADMVALLRAGGLEIDQVFGNHDGSPFEGTQPRMILVGHRN